MTPEVGQVWLFHCVGKDLLCLLVGRNPYGSFDMLVLEEGRVTKHWAMPVFGTHPGEWERFV